MRAHGHVSWGYSRIVTARIRLFHRRVAKTFSGFPPGVSSHCLRFGVLRGPTQQSLKENDVARVELDEIAKTYEDGFEAVKGLSLDVADGEFIVLVGPSGCGKSTTLRMVAGLESITGGELRIGGKRVNELAPKARDVAMVFQSYALYPHMTVFDNMAFGLKLQKMPRAEIEQRVRETAERLEITELLDRKPKLMSGGQRQRVAMGRAIVRRPRVFLFDEPLSNLDAKLRLHMRVELQGLHRSLGATSLYVTHDQVEAMTLADRIVLLNAGVVQQIGAPLELYERPQNEFVATFLGHPTMNVLDGEVTAGTLRLVGADFELPKDTAVSGPVRVGIRPQHLKVVDSAAALRGQVVAFEPLGGETLIHCDAMGQRIIASVDGHTQVALGANIGLAPSLEQLHFFDPDTGVRR